MRILQLRFKNLNSLLGEWQIALNDPAFSSDGIFAITGPTGAGKSTILDAICLALYGRTPRLNKITKSSNEIMSRHSGECFAEITFETPAGQFRCHWSQHRARKKSAGELQSPKHEIADALSGKIIEAKIRNVAERIESITGMDFERFTLSMLLAQGGFAAFLQAAPDQRAPILEEITGSDIYSHISTRVHELRANENKKRDTLAAKLAGMTLLSNEDESQLNENLHQQQINEQQLSQQHEKTRQAINWLENIQGIEKEILILEQEKLELSTRKTAFKINEEKLERAKRALEISADHARLCSLRHAQMSDEDKQRTYQLELPAINKALALANENSQKSEQLLLTTRQEQDSALPIIRKTQSLDLKLEEKQKPLQNLKHSMTELEQSFIRQQDEQLKCCSSLSEDQSAHTKLLTQIASHQADENLVDQLSGLQSRFSSLGEIDAQYRDKAQQLNSAETQSQETLKQWQQQCTQLDEQEKLLLKLKNDLKKQESHYLTSLAGQDISYWRKLQSSLNDKKVLIESLGLQLTQLTELQNRKEETNTRQSQLNHQHAEIIQKIRVEEDKQATLERESSLLETQLTLQKTINSLEQERKQLEDGKECPLCGAKQHPFATGNKPTHDTSTTELNTCKAKLNANNQQLLKLKVKETEYSTGIKQYTTQLLDTEQQINAQQELLNNTQATLTKKDALPIPLDKMSDFLGQLQRENIDTLNATVKLLNALDQQDKELLSTRTSLTAATHTFNQAEINTQTAKHNKHSGEQTRERLKQEYAALATQLTKAQQDTLNAVSIYGIKQLPDDGFAEVSAMLNTRRDQWLSRQQEKTQLEQSIARLTQQTQHQSQQLTERKRELGNQENTHSTLLKEFKDLERERSELFADKDPTLEETRLARAVATSEQQRDACALSLQSASANTQTLTEKINALSDNLLKRGKQLVAAEHMFKCRLEESHFGDEASYQAACISSDERNSLSQQADNLKAQQSGVDAKHQEYRQRLIAQRAKNITGQSLERLRQDSDKTLTQLRTRQQEIGALQQKLDDNKKLRSSQQEQASAIDAQTLECERWDKLHLLIGSADGKKYRNFAQGLTFELLVGHANRQLQKMTDRYLLTRDNNEPLELNVIDNYQAGEIRSTKNLSGGESFIVSLALALGLSQMASKNVRVDSLFLDEGFGTLDEDALDTALEALSSLQQSGKLIGVISHVSSLKERIATQIQVCPQTGGRSVVQGPGCKRLY